jgi:hypothetical protein
MQGRKIDIILGTSKASRMTVSYWDRAVPVTFFSLDGSKIESLSASERGSCAD